MKVTGALPIIEECCATRHHLMLIKQAKVCLITSSYSPYKCKKSPMKKSFLAIALPFFMIISSCSTTESKSSPNGSSSSFESNDISDASKVLGGRTIGLLAYGAVIYGLISLAASDDK